MHDKQSVKFCPWWENQDVHSELFWCAEQSERVYQTAESLHEIPERDGLLQILVERQGLPDSVDRTWGLFTTVHEELPGMLEDFLHTATKPD